jgi:hypothetical protein
MKSEIENTIEAAQQTADLHASNCADLLSRNQLAEALDYCKAQGIDPPQCSLTAESPNARKLREKAKGMLSDAAWWRKRLKTKALRDYEQGQIRAGKVDQGVSDAMLDYMTNKK